MTYPIVTSREIDELFKRGGKECCKAICGDPDNSPLTCVLAAGHEGLHLTPPDPLTRDRFKWETRPCPATPEWEPSHREIL